MHASSILAQRRVSRRSRTAALPALPHRPRPAQRPKSGGCKCGSASRGKRAASGRPSPGRSRRAGGRGAPQQRPKRTHSRARNRGLTIFYLHTAHTSTLHTPAHTAHCALPSPDTPPPSTPLPPTPVTLPRGRPTPPDPCTAEINYLWYAIETIRIVPWCIAQCASMSSTSQRVNAPDARRPVTYPRREALLDVHEIQLPNGLSPHPFPVGSLEPSLAAIAAQHACSGGATARGQRP
jgi:hypothetical protein